jgi:hypothetical protein
METAVRSIEKAVKTSRGDNMLPALTSTDHDLYSREMVNGPLGDAGYGDIDALSFCAAMRLLAEWRVLRQVPPGYKGYAVGMSLGQKDVIQNVGKLERAAHEWIDFHSFRGERRSPTLRQLLHHEIERDIHSNKLPRLKDNTAAMGLLWVRRQLHYQTTIFDNIISVPHKFPTCVSAISKAYTDVYGQFHGWGVQKIFNYSFQSAPHPKEIFRHMNPRRLEEVKIAVTNPSVSIDDEDDEVTVVIADSATEVQFISSDDKRRNIRGSPVMKIVGNLNKLGKHVEEEWKKFGKHVEEEWKKNICNISKIIKKGDDDNCGDNTKSSIRSRGGSSTKQEYSIDLSDEDIERITSEEMQKDATEHIKVFIRITRPILQDLEGLFDEMNMDDPTKV